MKKLKRKLKQNKRKWLRESLEKKLTLQRRRQEEKKLLLMLLLKRKRKQKPREKLSERRMPNKLNNTKR